MRFYVAISRRYPSIRATGPILAQLPPDAEVLLGDNPGQEQQLILHLFNHAPQIKQTIYHAAWNHHHSAARAIRDQNLIDDAEAVVVFTNGTDYFNGTDHYVNQTIAAAIAQSLPLTVYDRNADLLPSQPSIYDFAQTSA